MAKEFLTVEENSTEIEEIKYSISIEDLKKLDTIVIHNGMFHADDVIFISLILEARYEIGVTTIPKIIRAPRNDLKKIIDELDSKGSKYIIGDVGGGIFDHHDMLVVRHPSKIHNGDFIMEKRAEMPYAAASKLWLAIGEELVDSERFAREVDEKFFVPLDLNDNLGSIEMVQDKRCNNGLIYTTNIPNSFSMAISWLNGDPTNDLEQYAAFMKAVEFVRLQLRGMIKTYKNATKSYIENKVEELEETNKDKGYVVLDKYIPSYLFDINKIKFIVEPAINPGWWQVATTDSEAHPIINREMLKDVNHQLYLDLQNYDKSVDSGEIKTQKVFFHKTGFLASFPKQEWAEIVAYESSHIYNK